MIREKGGRGSDKDRAITVALEVITFLMADDETAGQFLGATGLDPEDLRGNLQDTDFLEGVLDYLLSREDLLISFCEQNGLEPTLPMRLKMALG